MTYHARVLAAARERRLTREFVKGLEKNPALAEFLRRCRKPPKTEAERQAMLDEWNARR